MQPLSRVERQPWAYYLRLRSSVAGHANKDAGAFVGLLPVSPAVNQHLTDARMKNLSPALRPPLSLLCTGAWPCFLMSPGTSLTICSNLHTLQGCIDPGQFHPYRRPSQISDNVVFPARLGVMTSSFRRLPASFLCILTAVLNVCVSAGLTQRGFVAAFLHLNFTKNQKPLHAMILLNKRIQ